jgi:hypothetical protein
MRTPAIGLNPEPDESSFSKIHLILSSQVRLGPSLLQVSRLPELQINSSINPAHFVSSTIILMTKCKCKCCLASYNLIVHRSKYSPGHLRSKNMFLPLMWKLYGTVSRLKISACMFSDPRRGGDHSELNSNKHSVIFICRAHKTCPCLPIHRRGLQPRPVIKTRALTFSDAASCRQRVLCVSHDVTA